MGGFLWELAVGHFTIALSDIIVIDERGRVSSKSPGGEMYLGFIFMGGGRGGHKVRGGVGGMWVLLAGCGVFS